MKSNNRRTVEFGLTGALSTGIPERPRFRLGKTFILLGAAALFYGAAFGLAQPAKADGGFTVAGINSTLPAWSQTAKTQETSQPRAQTADDSTFSDLTSYAQQIGAGTKTTQSSNSQFDDQTFTALRAFAERAGTAQPESIKGQPKLAEAQTLMDLLAGKGKESPGGCDAAKGRASGKRSSAPVDAHIIGSQACEKCHAPLIAEFKKTLMGKIGGVQKGKFECENCHGPGSAHVKAGGGRGVGGILSLRRRRSAFG